MRHQLAAHSPISARAVAAAATAVFGAHRDAREELTGLLRTSYAADDVILCGSGTQALQVAIQCARHEVGDNAVVALPAFSCFDIASAAVGAGGPFALYDLDPSSLSPEPQSLERALESGARIVVVAPLYGIPVDWRCVDQLASSRGALIIEDAAQGHGATSRGTPLGALGDISTISFGRGKGWTGGSGGAVLLRRGRRASVSPRVPGLRSNLRIAASLAAQWGLGRPVVYGLPRAIPVLQLGETVYHEPRVPAGMPLSAAAAALATRREALAESERRRAAGEALRAQIARHPAIRAVVSRESPDSTPGYIRFPLLARNGIRGFGDPSATVRLGIAPSYPRQLGELSEFARLVIGPSEWSGAARLARELVTFPVHSLVSRQDLVSLAARIDAYDER